MKITKDITKQALEIALAEYGIEKKEIYKIVGIYKKHLDNLLKIKGERWGSK